MNDFDPKKMKFQFGLSDDFIMGLLLRAEKDGVLPAIFYGDSKYTKDDFIKKTKEYNNLFFVVLYENEPAGFGLLDEMRWDHASFHFCIFSEYWGTKLAADGSREIYKRLLNHFSVLIGVVPVDNVFAVGFCRKLELKEIGVIPKYFYNDSIGSHVDGMQFVAVREG